MNWDRVNWENREIRRQSSEESTGPVAVADWPPTRPWSSRRATPVSPIAGQKARISKKTSPNDRASTKASDLDSVLNQIDHLNIASIRGWSPAELKAARDLCHRASLFFNKQLKIQPKAKRRLS